MTLSLAQLVAIVKFISNTLKVLKSIFPYWYTSRINTALGNPAVPSGTQFNIGAASSSDSNLIPDNIPLISIRLAPSVDSSITGALGEREIINRMSLALDSVGILTTHESEISLILNPQLSTDEFQNVDEPSLCQLVRHGASDRITGGSKILSFRASGAGNGQTSSTNYDLTKLSDLGNSILGGDGVYPNGPDLLCLVANIVDSTGVDALTTLIQSLPVLPGRNLKRNLRRTNMDVNHLPAESGTATLEDLVTALAAVQWDFAETEDAAAIESYKAARAVQGQLILRAQWSKSS